MIYNAIILLVTTAICCLMPLPLIKEARQPELRESNKHYYRVLLLIDLLAIAVIIAEDIRVGASTDLTLVAAASSTIAVSSLLIVSFWMRRLRKRETASLSEQYKSKAEDLIREFESFNQARHAQLKADVEDLDMKLQNSIMELQKAKEGSGSSPTLQAIASTNPLSKYDTGNLYVDAALMTKKTQLANDGIILDVKAQVPEDVSISPTELSALFFNLIDNAAREAKLVGGRHVSVHAGTIAGQMTLVVRNACNPELRERIYPKRLTKGNLDEEHGWGLNIVEHICEINGGSCSFEAQDGEFTSTCMIPL